MGHLPVNNEFDTALGRNNGFDTALGPVKPIIRTAEKFRETEKSGKFEFQMSLTPPMGGIMRLTPPMGLSKPLSAQIALLKFQQYY